MKMVAAMRNQFGGHAMKADDGNAHALEDVRRYIELCTKTSKQIVLYDLIENRYAIRPYGWPQTETQLLIAQLLVLGEIRSFLADHEVEELVTQTDLCDREVDEDCLGLDLWGILRVGELGLHVESEVVVEIQLLSTEDLNSLVAFLDDVSGYDGHEDGINVFLEVFDHDRNTVLNGSFEVEGVGFLGELEDEQIVFFESFLNPGDALQLRIDHQWVSFGVGEDCTVFDGDIIGGETLVVPLGDLHAGAKAAPCPVERVGGVADGAGEWRGSRNQRIIGRPGDTGR